MARSVKGIGEYMVANTDLMIQAATYLVPLILLFVGGNIYLDWLPFKILRVRSSGGKKILGRKRLPVRNRYYVGRVEGKDIVFKEDTDKGKGGQRLTIHASDIHHELCDIIEYDTDGIIYRPDGKIVSGFDPGHTQDLYLRESEKPPENNGAEKLKIFLAIASIIGLIGVGYLEFKNSQKLDTLLGMYDGLRQVLINSTVKTI